MSRFARKERPPPGFEILEPTLSALESELRESERNDGANRISMGAGLVLV